MNDQPGYQPKGGLCASCTKSVRGHECHKLPFHSMPVITTTDTGVKLVKCTEHDRIPPAPIVPTCMHCHGPVGADGAAHTKAVPSGRAGQFRQIIDGHICGACLSLKPYRSHKTVHARPMTRGAYNDYRGWALTEGENPDDPGYLVVYSKDTPDHYESWSPKKQFDDGYTEITERN